ncbi:Aste57867_2409 [Aphanomyces stellatus]|uniref:Aste57867_2409 protein n=1 Tax=Aphanomyces stellatus TaxID=120398 RepID=A0A485KB88_9STRA|nr:hypothetical protein As57867_002403 [Aphanomyces stellatus]VFT79610.1 Aste57867_2409 [Aphanomyces stellatus]
MRVIIFSSIFALASAGAGCGNEKPDLTVKTTSTGLSFRVLQVPDVHFTGDSNFPCNGGVANVTKCTEAYMEATLGRMLDDVKPDIVVFTGDQIEALSRPTSHNAEVPVRAYSKPVIARKLPWAMVYGNHDENNKNPEKGPDKWATMELIESLPLAYSKAGPKGIGGVSNYHLNVKAPADGFWGKTNRDIFRMYFVDTGITGNFTVPQADYFKSLASDYHAQNVPALMFFHIPTPHYKNFTGVGQGAKGETVTAGKNNVGLYDAMVAMGDVKASFVGHDHYNDYCFFEKPIHLCYGGGVGYGAAYGKPEYSRRARVIEWSLTPERESIDTYIYRQTAANDFEKYNIFQRKP